MGFRPIAEINKTTRMRGEGGKNETVKAAQKTDRSGGRTVLQNDAVADGKLSHLKEANEPLLHRGGRKDKCGERGGLWTKKEPDSVLCENNGSSF